MKFKLLRNGRWPVCTLMPPWNHYSDENQIKDTQKRVGSIRKGSKKNSIDPSNSPQKSNSNQNAINSAREDKGRGRLNKTAYLFNSNSPNKLLKEGSSKKNKGSDYKDFQEEDDALPVIRDEDFESHQASKNINNTEIDNKYNSKANAPSSAIQNSKYRANANAIYDIRRGRKGQHVHFNQPNRLHSHQNKTKVRIQGKHGRKTEKYVNIQRSIEEQK